MRVSQAYLNGELARRLFEKTIEQLQNSFFLFESMEQVAQFFASEVQIEADQIAGAFHVELGGEFDVEQSLRIEQRQFLEQGVVGGALLLEAAFQIGVDVD